MFVRTVETKSGGKTHRYLRVVESYRHNGKIRQRVLWNLGNLEKIRRELPGLARGLGRYAGEQLVSTKKLKNVEVREYGNILLLETIWKGLGIDEILSESKVAEKARPSVKAAVFHSLLGPGGRIPLDEWVGRVYLPEMVATSRPGRIPPTKGLHRFFKYLSLEAKDGRLRAIAGNAHKSAAPFCYIIGLKQRALEPHLGQSGRKGSLLAVLTAGGVPVAYGVYEGKDSLTFIRDIRAGDGPVQYMRRRVVFIAHRSAMSEGVISLFIKDKIPFAVFIGRLSKKGVGRRVFRVRRGLTAHRVRGSSRKGLRTYVILKGIAKSRTERHVVCTFRTNMTGTASISRVVKAHKELLKLEEFLGNLTLPAGVSRRAESRKGYMFIGLLAYLMAGALERGLSRARTGWRLSTPELLERLRDIKVVTNVISGRRLDFVTKIPRQTRELLRAFGIKNPRILLLSNR